MVQDNFTPSSQPCSSLNLIYEVWDEENFNNALGDCLYFSIFQPKANLEKGANDLAQFKKIISGYKDIPLSQDQVCEFIRILNLAEEVCETGKQVAATTNMAIKEQLEGQFSKLRQSLLENAPKMTHMRMEWDWEDEILRNIKEDAEHVYPDDLEAQENHMGSLFGYKYLTL